MDLWGDPSDYRCLTQNTQPTKPPNKYKIYIICPVRDVSEAQQVIIDAHAEQLRNSGIEVFLPTTDSPQSDKTGMTIIRTEAEAIMDSDRVDVLWDSLSMGSHFDFGMAFILNKKIKLIHCFNDDVKEKSYQKCLQLISGGSCK